MFPRTIHVGANRRIPLFLLNNILYMSHFVYSFIDGNLGRFHVFAIIDNNAAVNMREHIIFQVGLLAFFG